MFLSYAVDRDNNWIHINDVPFGGRAHDLCCPFCQSPLMAKKGAVLIHHFAHEANQSCRAWSSVADYIPPYEGYYVADLSRPQQRVLNEILQEHSGRPFDANHIRSQTLESLATKRFLEFVYVPYLYRHPEHNQNPAYQRLICVAQLTPRAQAFAHQLSLADYAIFAETEHQQAIQRLAGQEDPQARLALTMLQVEYQRWQDTHLYLLEIESDIGPLLKVGITTRPLGQRISEVKAFLQQHFLHVAIRPLFDLPQVPYLEGYFKSKFAQHQVEIANATEYFKPFDQAYQEMAALQQLVEMGIPSPVPVPSKNPARPRFRATFWRTHAEQNPYGIRDALFLVLVNVTNLATLERFADWQVLAYGKQFEALGKLAAGDVIEFNAAIDGDNLKRPTKIIKLGIDASA